LSGSTTIDVPGATAVLNTYMAGTYHWIATYNGDTNNVAVSTLCTDPAEAVTIRQATPTITTTASPGGVVGTSIFDTATVSGRVNPTPGNTVTFTLFSPSDPTCTTAVFTSPSIPLNGGGSASSPVFTTITAGIYRWIAHYNGDTNNAAVSSLCTDPAEAVTISQATPTITTTASAGGVVGTSIFDTATVSGRVNPTPGNTVTFTLFSDPACTIAVFTSANIPLNGGGSATSGSFTTTTVGAFRWIATYSGDTNNAGASTLCTDPAEQVTISQATPTITTTASAGGVVGTSIFDTATVSGRVNPTGPGNTVTFRLFSDPACTTPVFTSPSIPLNGGGSAISPSFTPATVGTYRWIATYSGDTNNAGASTLCTDPAEAVTITQATPTIATTAQPVASGPVGISIFDTATVSGRVNPTGPGNTVTFRLFSDPACATLLFTSPSIPLNAGGTANSPSFTPTTVGVYRWIATYSGDTNNAGASTACTDPAEQVTLGPVTPRIDTRQSPFSGVIGTSLTDTATLTLGLNPTGTVTFRLFPPSDPTCSGSPVYTTTTPLSGGSASAGPATATASGTWRWVARYDGDANNNPVSSLCQEEPTVIR